jgi:Protein of unknown function (DUF3618)
VTTTRTPDVIVREIEQTRAELAEAIDAITDRINPRKAASRGARAVRDKAASAMPGDGGRSATGGPRLAVLAAAGVFALIAGVVAVRRHR